VRLTLIGARTRTLIERISQYAAFYEPYRHVHEHGIFCSAFSPDTLRVSGEPGIAKNLRVHVRGR
jgi:hypothetical protein